MDGGFETDKRFTPKLKILSQPGKSKARKDAYFYIHDNEQELRKFYNQYFKYIWEVQAEEWAAYLLYMSNYGVATVKCKPNETLVVQLIDMIEYCVKYCFAQFNKVTSPEFLHTMTVLVQIAHTKNMKSLRQKGFRIALSLLHLHRDADHLFEVLMYIFDLQPFIQQGQQVKLKYDHESKDRANGLLVPKPTGQATTKEETLEFLGEWFRWIEDQNDFNHWFGMIKKFLYVLLFPEASKKLQIKPSHDDTGFPCCPPDLQEFITTRYHQWYTMNPKFWAILWSTDENQEIVMELLRAGCKLEVADLGRQTKIFNLFFENLVVTPLRIISTEKLLEHQTTFFTVLPTVFDSKHVSDDSKIIDNMIGYFRRCGEVNIWNNLDKTIRNTLQKSFLNMSVAILTPAASQNVNSLDNFLCPKLLEIIFHLWIYTQETEFDQWFYLQDRLRTMFHRPKAVEIIQTKILQVSYHYIHEFLYDFRAFDPRFERIQNSSKKGGISLSPDGHKNSLKRQEPLQSITPWTYETLTAIWNYVFDILRYTNMEVLVQVKGEAVVVEICRCFKQVVYMFIMAEELGGYDDEGMYHKLDIVAAFVLWLWRHTTGLPGLCLAARKQAYLALCRLFCRKSQYIFPVHLLTKFYDTLDYGLNFHKKPLPQGYAQTAMSSVGPKGKIDELLCYVIFESTVSIFSIGLPGADILIPAYLVEISAMFNSKNRISKRTAERALLLIASLVSYSRHFSFMPDIPTSEHVLAFLDIKHFICDIVEGRINCYAETQELTEAHLSLSILAVILLEEIHYQTPEFEFFMAKLSCITNQVRLATQASYSALMALETISLFFPIISFYDLNIPVGIIKELCGIIVEQVHQAKDEAKINLILAEVDCLQTLIFALPHECFLETLGLMRSVCETIGNLVLAKNNLFQTHGRELTTNITNFLHNFPPEGRYDTNCSTTIDDADNPETLWSSIGDNVFSARDVPGANHELLSPTLLYWVMHCISNPQQGQVTHRRLAYFFAPYLSSVAPNLISVWCYLDTVGPHFLEEQLNFIGATLLSFFNGVNGENQGLYCDGAPPPTFPPGDTWTVQDFMQLKNEMIQLIAIYYNNFSQTKEYALALNTTSRITSRDATGVFSWDMELNQAGYPRWTPVPGVVERFGGPQTRINWTPQPENLPQVEEPLIPTKIKLQSDQPMLKCKWPPTPTQGKRARKPDVPDVNVAEMLGGTENLSSALEDLNTLLDDDQNPMDEPEPNEQFWADIDRYNIENDPRNANRVIVPIIQQTLTTERFLTLAETELALLHQFKEENYPTPAKEVPHFEIPPEDFVFIDVNAEDDLDALQPLPMVPNITEIPSVQSVTSLQKLMQYTQQSVLNFDGGAVEWGTQEYNRDNPDSQDAISQTIYEMCNQEASNLNAVEIHRASPQVLDLHTAQPPNPVHPIGPLSHSRTFYTNFGWLSPEACKDNFVWLNHLESASNFKHIKGLDSNKGREVVKCGLLYVAHGQQDEKEILRNDATRPSNTYHEFVKSLAPIVDIHQSFGYMGGLEKYSREHVGTHTPYYATPLVEFVVHEAVRMPNTDDPASENKKRHIGNEYVHIVWSEHVASYLPWTVISQFNSCHIIIYPLTNGLYRIQVAKKPEIPNTAGPLVHNFVLHKQLLGPLVRQTAINMTKLSRISNKQNEDPYLIRAEKLGIVINKCCAAGKFQEMLALTLSRMPSKVEEKGKGRM